MTDHELIQLLQEKLPEELTPEMLETLRQRLRENPQLRQALLLELKVEQGLATTYAPSPKRWEQILAQRKSPWRQPWVRLALGLAAGLLVLTLALSLMILLRPHAPRPDTDLAATQPAGNGGGNPTDTVAAIPLEIPDKPAPETPATPPPTPTDGNPDHPASAPADTVAAAPPSPAQAAWLMFDDPAQRRDLAWVGALPTLWRPLAGARITRQDNGVIVNGTYLLTNPPNTQRMLRLGVSQSKSWRVDLWNDLDGVRLEVNRLGTYSAWRLQRTAVPAVPVAEAAPRVDPRLARANQAERLDSVIYFNWSSKAPLEKMPREDYAVRWTGLVNIPKGGEWTFITTSDDGVRLSVDNRTVIDDWNDHPPTESKTTLQLSAGLHPIELLYYQNTSDATIKLEWSGPNTERQLIPAKALHPYGSGQSSRRSPPANLKINGLTGTYYWGNPVLAEIPADVGTPAPTTETVQILSDDGLRRKLLGDGILDFRWQDGQVVLARGDVVLLTAPLAKAPNSGMVTLQGELQFAGVLPCLPLELPTPKLGRNVVLPENPAGLNWESPETAPRALRKLADGGVELSVPAGDKSEAPIHARLRLPAPAGSEVVFRVSRATADAGFFLRPPGTERPIYFWLIDQAGARTLTDRPDDENMRRTLVREGWTFPGSFWVKANFGAGHVRLSLSPDGRSWTTFGLYVGETDAAPVPAEVEWGLVVHPRTPTARIAIDRLRQQHFDAYRNLADAALVAQVPTDLLRRNTSHEDFYRTVLQAKPENVSISAWLTATDVALLTKPSNYRLRRTAMVHLLQVAGDSADPARLGEALGELPFVAAVGQEPTPWGRVLPLYDAAAQACLRHNRPELLGPMLDAYLRMPVGSSAERDRPAAIYPPQTLRLELLQRLDAGQWPALEARARQAMLLLRYNPDNEPSTDLARNTQELAAYLAALAYQHLPARSYAGSPTWLVRWTHPLTVDTDRESANVMAEFVASVQNKAYDNACRLLTRRLLPPGITPDPTDNRLFRSSHVVVRTALRDDPQLGQLLRAQYSSLAELRLRQALEHNSSEALESLTVQFFGTPAAATALQRLADQELTLGNFYTAAARYSQLLQDYPPADPTAIAAKRRLALAMTGELAGEPVGQAVTLPGGTFTAEEFERLVTEVAKTRFRTQDDKPAVANQTAPGPGTSTFTGAWLPLTRLASGDSIQVNRDIGWAFQGDTLYVQQRGRLSCMDLNAGKELWNNDTGRRDRTDLDYVPGAPLPTAQSLLATTLRGRAADLMRVTVKDGRPSIRVTTLDNGVISDPIMVGPWVYVLSVRNTLGQSQLNLHRIVPTTGENVLTAPVARLRTERGLFNPGRPALAGDALVFRCGAALMSVSLLGEVRWIRQLYHFAADALPNSPYDQNLTEPIIRGDRAIVAGPGSPFVVAVDVRSGAQLWSSLQPNLRKLAGVVRDKVILATDDALLALDLATGKPVWRVSTTALPNAILPAADDTILAVDTVTAEDNRPVLRLRWHTVENGAVTAERVLTNFPAWQPHALVSDGRWIVGLAGQSPQNDDDRLLVLRAGR